MNKGLHESEVSVPLVSFLPAVLWAGVIFYFSSIPASDILPLFPYADIIFHFSEYFILSGLVYFGLKNYWEKRPSAGGAPVPSAAGKAGTTVLKTAFWTLIICFLYAASDEFHQLFVCGRTATLFDLGVDILGAAALLFSLLGFLVFKKR